MEAYLRVLVNYKQNNWARLLSMAEFAYNNVKNTSIGYTSSELNCGYHLKLFCNKDVNPRSNSKTVDQLATELLTLMFICKENLQYA